MNAISVLAIAIAIMIARTEVMASATAIRAVEPDPVSAVCKITEEAFAATAAATASMGVVRRD